jgi:hypothetical protein
MGLMAMRRTIVSAERGLAAQPRAARLAPWFPLATWRNACEHSVSGCVNDNFADYIKYWKHNGYWLFDSPEIIRAVARENSIQLEGTSLFYYEVYEMEFDCQSWSPYQPERSIPTNIIPALGKRLEGFDVVTFSREERT